MATQTLQERIDDTNKTPLAEDFISKIRTIAGLTTKSEDEIWERWCKYSNDCLNSDQSALVFEFCQWNNFPMVD